MIVKKRSKSVTHQVLESLHYRLNLSNEDQTRYKNQVKGLEGERQSIYMRSKIIQVITIIEKTRCYQSLDLKLLIH